MDEFGLSFQPLRVTGIHSETKDFKTLIFGEGHNILYEAGQFITLVDQRRREDIRRSYSIISSPETDEPLAIGVKRVANGYFSRKLTDETQIGDILLCTGASGFFRLPKDGNNIHTLFFFAAGSGITPVISLIKTALVRLPFAQIHLIYSNSNLASTAFYKFLIELESKHPHRFQIEFLFSNAPDLRKARLNRDLFLRLLDERLSERRNTLFYVCGPESYMRMIIFQLLEEGFENDQIRKEDFNTRNLKAVRKHPPDRKDHQVTLELNGRTFQFPVYYPNTILQSAKKIKLNLPYSCETGKCGTCAAVCIAGEVWLSNNEVLTEKDLSSGLTLTCTGHPQNGDIILKIE